MGGGKKKPTMTQMAKAASKKDEEGESKSTKRPAAAPGTEKRTLRIVSPDPRDKNITKELQKMKVLTPYAVASRFNIRISVAKDFLEELRRQGTVAYVSGGRNVKIYKPLE